jgi:hypothetical protein
VFKGISIYRTLYTNADAMFLSLTACNNVISVQVDLYQGGTMSEPGEFCVGHGILRHNPGVPLTFALQRTDFISFILYNINYVYFYER